MRVIFGEILALAEKWKRKYMDGKVEAEIYGAELFWLPTKKACLGIILRQKDDIWDEYESNLVGDSSFDKSSSAGEVEEKIYDWRSGRRNI